MIIGIAGRIAAGKETLTQFLRDQGFSYNETGALLLEVLEEQGIEGTRWNQQNLADEWRQKDGAGAIMKKFLEKLDLNKTHIIDSLRNAGEAEYLKEQLGDDFVLIAVDAPREIRFKRLVERDKPNDPKVWEDFLKVDERDNFDPDNPMGQQTGKLIEAADFVIMNDKDLEHAMNQVKEIWEEIKKKCS